MPVRDANVSKHENLARQMRAVQRELDNGEARQRAKERALEERRSRVRSGFHNIEQARHDLAKRGSKTAVQQVGMLQDIERRFTRLIDADHQQVVEEGRRSQRKNEDRLADLDRQRRALPWD